MRQRGQSPGAHLVDHLPEHVREVGHAWPDADGRKADGLGEAAQIQHAAFVDVLDAEFQKPSIRCKAIQSADQQASGKRVQHDIHAPAAGNAANAFDEIETSRIEHGGDAKLLQICALVRRPRGAQNRRARLSRNLHRGEPDATGGGVDQTVSPRRNRACRIRA